MIKLKYIQSILLISILLSCNSEKSTANKETPLYNYNVEQRISELGVELIPQKLPPGIKIEFATQSNNLVYLSGHGPFLPNGEKVIGKIGTDLSIDEGYQAARLTAINHLSVLKEKIGDLNNVVRVVKVLGMVNADTDFTEHPAVINGYSDLLIEVFGDRGKHARSAIGMNSLPWNIACEVEAIIEIKN